MIKKFLNKIVSLFKNNKDKLPLEITEKEINNLPIQNINNTYCDFCKKELKGKRSAVENDIQYIVCENCGCVNKFKNNEKVKCNKEDIYKAYDLFKKNGFTPAYYKEDLNDKRNFF